MTANGNIIIVGAGIAGLTLAYKLRNEGRRVLLVEKEARVGGLARSYRYDGFVFDIGPHRFHTEDREVLEFILEILGENYLEIQRRSGVWMFNRYFDWPLTLSALFRMPIPELLSVGFDLVMKSRRTGADFESYIIQHYGNTLFEIFFKPYTEKFLGIPTRDISKDWAVTGIERAVIDGKLAIDDLTTLLRSLLCPRSALQFLYPKGGGIGIFSEHLMQKITASGVTVLLNSSIGGIVAKGKEIKNVVINGNEYACDELIWTGALPELLSLLGHDRCELDYLSLVLYNYRVDHGPLLKYQWCYYGAEDIPFNRVSSPNLFDPMMAPHGASGLCVEVTSRKNDERWLFPETLEPEIRRTMVRCGLIKNATCVLGVAVEKIPHAYPIYTLDYSRKLKAANEMLSEILNLTMLGRTGSFWYNNMDHSIRAAFNLSKTL